MKLYNSSHFDGHLIIRGWKIAVNISSNSYLKEITTWSEQNDTDYLWYPLRMNELMRCGYIIPQWIRIPRVNIQLDSCRRLLNCDITCGYDRIPEFWMTMIPPSSVWSGRDSCLFGESYCLHHPKDSDRIFIIAKASSMVSFKLEFVFWSFVLIICKMYTKRINKTVPLCSLFFPYLHLDEDFRDQFRLYRGGMLQGNDVW